MTRFLLSFCAVILSAAPLLAVLEPKKVDRAPTTATLNVFVTILFLEAVFATDYTDEHG